MVEHTGSGVVGGWAVRRIGPRRIRPAFADAFGGSAVDDRTTARRLPRRIRKTLAGAFRAPEPADQTAPRRLPGRALAGSAGVLPVLAYPAPSWWWFAWGALVPLTLVVRGAPTRREGMVRAWWGVTAFQVSVQYWLLPDIGPALPLFSVILAAFWLPWGWTVHRFLAAPLTGRRVAAALLVVPSAWICAEAVRSWQSLGGPWALLGATQWNQPTMLASASLGGVWFTGFLIVVANTALVVVLLEARARTRADAAVTLAACTAVGPAWSAVRPGLPLVGTAEVAIVQPGTGASAYDQQAFETSATAALAGRPLDLVVWGESSVADDLTGDPDLTGSLPALVRSLGADLLVNGRASASGPSGSYNESVLIGPAGTLGDYAKMRLVPFGEYIPFRAALGWLTSISKATSSNLIRGGAVTVVHAGPLAVGPLLCFESAFPDMARTEVSRGAQLLVYQNNTSTFQKSWAQPQHAALAAVRAAEAGRPVVHASLTGVSAVFDAHGRKLAWRPATFRGAFITRIPLVSGTTPYERTGDWTLVLAVLILGAAVTHDALRSFRG